MASPNFRLGKRAAWLQIVAPAGVPMGNHQQQSIQIVFPCTDMIGMDLNPNTYNFAQSYTFIHLSTAPGAQMCIPWTATFLGERDIYNRKATKKRQKWNEPQSNASSLRNGT